MHRFLKMKAVLLALLVLAGMQAEQSVAQDKTKGRRARSTAAPGAYAAESVLDVNNFTSWLTETGEFADIDPVSHSNGTFPKGTAGAVFRSGLFWGGVRVTPDGTRRVLANGNVYDTGLAPGRVLWDPASGVVTGVDNPDDEAKYHVWRVHRDWRTLDYATAVETFGGSSAEELQGWYEYDWNNWPADMGAPYEENNGTPGYQPPTFDAANNAWIGDIPGYPGADQTLWIVANDFNTSQNTYGSEALGMEYQVTAWAYDFAATSPLGNINFIRHRLIYTGLPNTPRGTRIDSMFAVQFVDPDLGDYSDDYAGADTSLSLGYIYNANPTDAQYQNFGLAPPAAGWDFLQGPITAEGDTLGLTAFVYFAAGSSISDPDEDEYTGTLQWFNLMRGHEPRPPYPADAPFQNPLTGEETPLTLPGDPVTGEGWVDGLEQAASDRRIVLASGPFSAELGDTIDVVVAQVGGLGSSNLSSVTVLKYFDVFAQFAYDNDFVLPTAPDVPEVNVAELDGQIILNWGGNQQEVRLTESSNVAGFQFEGYNVYQLPSPTAAVTQGVRVATFDLINETGVITEPSLDPNSGLVLEAPVQFGSNSGIQRFFATDRDEIRQAPLANGVEYYYAITAYSRLADEDVVSPFNQLESSPVRVTVIPQTAAPGELAGTPQLDPDAIEIEQTSGSATSDVSVRVVDPSQVQSGNYEVRFGYYNPATGTASTTLAEGDTLTSVAGLEEAEFSSHPVAVGDPFPVRWALFRDGQQVGGWNPQIDEAGGTTVESAPIIEGIQVQVPTVVLGISRHEVPSGNANRWLTGFTGFGLSGFFGGADVGSNFLGSTLDNSLLAPVRLEFEADTTDGWIGRGKVYVRGGTPSYGIAGTGYLPLAAYVINPDGSTGRRLNTSFVEQAGCVNMRWDIALLSPPECEANNFREYLMIHWDDYDEGARYTTDGIPMENVAYAISPAPRGVPYLAGPFTLELYPSLPPTAGSDVYAFSLTGRSLQDSLFTQSVDDIGVFPNPYLGFSQLETSRFEKFVTFTHLPDEATIRIFDLAGTMVREIAHTGNVRDQYERWDLLNQEGLPVASGIYIAHVETANGEKVLKIALVQEQQILQRY